MRVAGGQALMMMDQPGLAEADIRAGVELSERAGWTHGLALALTMQCRLDLRTDRLQQLVVHSERALAAYEAADQPSGQAIALGWLGLGHLLTGNLPASLAAQRRAISLHHVSQGRFDRAATLTNLGETLHLLGRSAEALEHLDEALAIFGEMGQPVDEAATHTCLAIVYRDTGRETEAAAEAARARELCAQIDDLMHRIGAEHVWATIAAARAEGPARQLFAEALRLAGQFTMRHPEAEIRTSLARALRAEGRCEEAVAEACQALALAEAGAYRVVAARANAVLAEALADLGQPAQAAHHAARAATLRAETGLRL
jgi:tetratricopeptide (TPR) repeat protein